MKINWAHWRRVRQTVQILFFALFVYLLFAALQRRGAFPLADLFFRLNPLSALTAMLASRGWIPRLGWALIIVGLTILAGRVWCGWICPFGTLLEWISFRRARLRAKTLSLRLRTIKYILLVIILIAALLGNLTLAIFDPIALFTRAMTTVIIPAINYAFNTVESALYSVGFLRPVVDWLEESIRGPVLPVKQPAFDAPLLITILFCGIIALNLLADRFWCRYLCPLGALLGWLSKISIFRPVVGSACTGCTRCAVLCRPGAILAIKDPKGLQQQDSSAAENIIRPLGSKRQIELMPSECTVCLDCLVNCTKSGMGFEPALSPTLWPAPHQEYDLSRRQFLQAMTAGAAGLLLTKVDLRLRRKNSLLIRPPGVENEGEFLSKCLRCTQCMKVCPTTTLQPALSKAGLEGLWTPCVTPRIGYCDYGCNACGQVCPSGAIPPLTLDQKRQAIIGKASVNRDRCLPWASATPCIVCEEMCPVPEKAIRLEQATMVNDYGENVDLQRPYVLRELCIGCGICENRCPLEGDAAIQVYSV
jgi:polyferredoxin